MKKKDQGVPDNKKDRSAAMVLWRGFLPFAVYIAVNDLVQIILSFIVDHWTEQGFALSEVLREYSGNVTLIIQLIAAFLGYYAVVRLTGPGPRLMVKPNISADGKEAQSFEVYLFQTVFAVMGAVSLALAVNVFFGLIGALEKTGGSSFSGTMYNVSLAAGILVYGIFIPYVEEMLFRGIIFGRVREKTGRAAAVLLSAVLFAVMHGSLSGAVYAFIMGCVFALAYEFLRWIAVPYLCHAAANIVIFIITFFGAFGKLVSMGRFAEFLAIAAASLVLATASPSWQHRR